MFRVHSAETVQAGSFILNSFFLSFINDDKNSRFGNDHTWNLGLTYGLNDRLELTAQIVPYQDDQRHSWAPPGETKVGVKWATPLSGQRVQTGLRGFVRLPTAKTANRPFEPYSSGKVALGAVALLSLDIPGRLPLRLNFNFGYLDNDISTFLSRERTDQLLLGVGVKLPIRAIIFYTEYTGEIFFNHDKISFRDNSMRLTHGFKFRVPFNLVLDLGADIGFSNKRQRYPAPLHEYADWKIFMGLSYHFLTSRVWRGVPQTPRIDRKKQQRKLQELRSRRERVDQELNEMLNELEKEVEKEKNEP
ncbi:MAG: hypothetical protein ACE5IY_12460 [bacterium]